MHQTPGQHQQYGYGQQPPQQQPYAPPPQQWGPPPVPPRPPAKKTSPLTVVIVGAVILLVAIVGTVAKLTSEDAPKPKASATSSSEQHTDLAVPDVPDLTGAQRDAYLAALGAIDPGLVVNEERAVRRGQNTCLDILEHKSTSTVVHNAQVRFTGGDATVSAAQARQVVKAIKAWCPAP